MSPTEILAKQHYDLAKKIFKNMNIKIEFLTGKTEYKKRKEINSNILNGKIEFLIGTHALFQKKFFSRNLVWFELIDINLELDKEVILLKKVVMIAMFYLCLQHPFQEQ